MALFTFGFACLFEFGLISSVVLPMAIVSAAYEFGFALPQKCRNYPIHGYLVNFLLMGGLNEHVVVVLGHCIDLLWNYAMDLFVCVLSFLATTVTIETVGRAFGAFL
jgi:hypothetical protein